jgi:hypothetical protein
MEAITREMTAKNPFGLVVMEPMIANISANTEAVTDDMIDIKTVSISLSMIFGSRLNAFASGIRLTLAHRTTRGIAVKASPVSKFVKTPAP